MTVRSAATLPGMTSEVTVHTSSGVDHFSPTAVVSVDDAGTLRVADDERALVAVYAAGAWDRYEGA